MLTEVVVGAPLTVTISGILVNGVPMPEAVIIVGSAGDVEPESVALLLEFDTPTDEPVWEVAALLEDEPDPAERLALSAPLPVWIWIYSAESMIAAVTSLRDNPALSPPTQAASPFASGARPSNCW